MNNTRQGLILVEAALAMVVLAVGIFAVFALFGRATDSGAKARDETEAALFAQSTFDSLRAHSALESSTASWSSFAESLCNGDQEIGIACGGPKGCWVETNVSVIANGLQLLVYSNFPLRASSVSNVVNQALRYRLDAEPRSDNGWTNRIELTLRVWQGMYGPTNDSAASIFYTELDNQGSL